MEEDMWSGYEARVHAHYQIRCLQYFPSYGKLVEFLEKWGRYELAYKH